jgi:hypothetical protein
MFKRIIASILSCLLLVAGIVSNSKPAWAYDASSAMPDITIVEYDPHVPTGPGGFYIPWTEGTMQCSVSKDNIPTVFVSVEVKNHLKQIGIGIESISAVVKLGGQELPITGGEGRLQEFPGFDKPLTTEVRVRAKSPNPIAVPTQATLDSIVNLIDTHQFQKSGLVTRNADIVVGQVINDNFVPVVGSVPTVTCYPKLKQQEEFAFGNATDSKYTKDLAIATGLSLQTGSPIPLTYAGQLTADVLAEKAPGWFLFGIEAAGEGLGGAACILLDVCPAP